MVYWDKNSSSIKWSNWALTVNILTVAKLWLDNSCSAEGVQHQYCYSDKQRHHQDKHMALQAFCLCWDTKQKQIRESRHTAGHLAALLGHFGSSTAWTRPVVLPFWILLRMSKAALVWEWQKKGVTALSPWHPAPGVKIHLSLLLGCGMSRSYIHKPDDVFFF